MNGGRYIRQKLLDRIGESGQQSLLASTVAVVGCGGLGSIAAPYLAGAGIGKLVLIDGDRPDQTNLHRQVFFKDEESIKTKSELLGAHIRSLNPDIVVEVYSQMITKENIRTCLLNCDVVLECTDNIQAKYLINDYCHLSRIQMIYGAIHKYDGFVSNFPNRSDEDIHLRDIFPVPSDEIPSCSEVGVLGTIAGLIGILQANEAIKSITKAGTSLAGKMLSYDILTNRQMILGLKKSYSKDLSSIYNTSSYDVNTTCDVAEIKYSQIMQNRDAYELISILENHEHQDVDSNIVRLPLSSFQTAEWKPLSQKPHVFYCISGKRSAQLIDELTSRSVGVDLYSLSGGLRSIRAISSDSQSS